MYIYIYENYCEIMANVLDGDVVVSELELQSLLVNLPSRSLTD